MDVVRHCAKPSRRFQVARIFAIILVLSSLARAHTLPLCLSSSIAIHTAYLTLFHIGSTRGREAGEEEAAPCSKQIYARRMDRPCVHHDHVSKQAQCRPYQLVVTSVNDGVSLYTGKHMQTRRPPAPCLLRHPSCKWSKERWAYGATRVHVSARPCSCGLRSDGKVDSRQACTRNSQVIMETDHVQDLTPGLEGERAMSRWRTAWAEQEACGSHAVLPRARTMPRSDIRMSISAGWWMVRAIVVPSVRVIRLRAQQRPTSSPGPTSVRPGTAASVSPSIERGLAMQRA
jgi:hypothetical protein